MHSRPRSKGSWKTTKKQFEYKYQVLGHKQGDTWAFGIVHILANNASSVEKVSYFEPESFSGTMHHYDLKGKYTKAMAFEQGELVGEITDMEDMSPTAVSKEPPVSNEGVWVFITVERYIDMYMYRGGGVYEYSYSVHNGTQHEWAFISTGGTHSTYGHEQGEVYHGHHAGPSAPANPEDSHPEEIINKLTGKAKCVYDKLITTKNIQELLADFFGNDAEFDLTLQLVSNLVCGDSDSPNGCTSANYDYNSKKVVISIDKDYVDNYSLLVVGKTIVHEIIHANLFLAVKKLNGGITPNNINFESLYEQYRNQKGWQHEFMANHYVDLIAESLEEFHSQLNDDVFKNYYDNWSWDDFYTKLAWTGLKNTTKGQTYYEEYGDQISIYYEAAKVNSTKTMNCN